MQQERLDLLKLFFALWLKQRLLFLVSKISSF